ncbi:MULTISPECIES: acetyl-CoA carboxylase, carboxyltransferase subunit beta [unclassified Granulicatella]|uniref:acetyl-CoA carboxylase, carboxyltransferase subunit beta n=1 Tax=unclassified Granulicatella TaxID=2630493 RepID=UPI0010739847|nr:MULTISPECIES: acetyl-CoA carboxylase, carboxyltransferase subunit beta [unclassified Granulicatella]MBF0780897.1 acetyl-CoA carboxylase carboxyltransferase subunit beta [Granulicatella sp. 19428wC4_WM01]TFU93248.1 acetyl-CoA carboxylase carboxyltransferase subunit beta [Granulicatella sp. WM01]
MGLFRKKAYIKMPTPKQIRQRQQTIPDGLWEKCPNCHQIIYLPEMSKEKICPACQYHFRLSANERLNQIIDTCSYTPLATHVPFSDPLNFPGYMQKVQTLKQTCDSDEAVSVGIAKIGQHTVAIGVMDTHFIMGSMGYTVGERITRLFEEAIVQHLPVILFCASGGARMQEGIQSLMQMAKVSNAIANHSKQGLLYISILTDPTTGGVTASFAMQADIILAEPGATVGFAGKRVIEQTIKQTVPDDFQSAETVQKNGFIDCIVNRKRMKDTLIQLLNLHQKHEEMN